MKPVPRQKEEINKFREIIENIKIGILFTHCGNQLNGRPMTTAGVDSNANLWFFTNEFSTNVYEITKNKEVFVNYANPCLNAYAVVNGKAYLTRDINKINELYTPSVKTWFPGGLNDPNLLLLRIEPEEVQYWSGNSSKIVSTFKMLSDMSSDDEYIQGAPKQANLNYLQL